MIDDLGLAEAIVAVVFTAAAFVVSAAAGLGGSLLLVPALATLLGTKEGVALAALLLASNNVVKVWAYRATVPWRQSSGVAALTMVGTFVGAVLLVNAPDRLVTIAVVVALVSAFAVERIALSMPRPVSAASALAAGATSGFSGSSGPLKGIALRALALDRRHLVGAAALVSFLGDATKATVFADAGLLGAPAYTLAVFLVPVMIGGTYAGRRLNKVVGEQGYNVLFWTVMSGYSIRLIAAA